MSEYEYASITNFGAINQMYNDPTLYSVLNGLDSQFMFGGGVGFAKGNENAANFMSNRCAAKWDQVCQAVSEDPQKWYPRPQSCPAGLTDGEAMLRESAFKHFLLGTKNCYSKCSAFDPTVATSPLVCSFIDTAPTTGPTTADMWLLDGRPVDGGCSLDRPGCQKFYGFTEAQMQRLDTDAIMSNLLERPYVAMDLLEMLAQWVKSTGNMGKIAYTKFNRFAKRNNLY